jgi:Helicase associated domain
MRTLFATGDLDPEWTCKLNSLEFKWDAVDVDWNAMVDRLVAYKAKHNSVSVPRQCNEDPPLGNWVRTVRSSYGIFLNEYRGIDEDMIREIAQAKASVVIPAEVYEARLRRLYDVGFVFDEFEAKWLEMYERLLQYKKEHNSTLVPEVYEPDLQLGIWVFTQRRQVDNLSTGRLALLEEIGFEWDPLSKAWNDMYEKLRKYKEEHGNIRVIYHYNPCPELGQWVSGQRRLKKLGILSKKRSDALDSLGFV